jgi:hypothetical protein
MSDTSNSSYPLIANNPASIAPGAVLWSDGSTGGGSTAKGAIWKGKQAIVVHVDDSASVDVLSSTFQDKSGPTGIDLFDTTGQKGWMAAGTAGAGNNVIPAN